MAEEEIAQKNILEYQKTVAELCRKVADDRWMQYRETTKGERDARLEELQKKDAQIASLRAIIKELADALENEISKIEPNYNLVDSLVAKAREACK